MGFETKLIDAPVVKATEFKRHSAEHSNQRQLPGDDSDDKSKPRGLRKRQRMLGFGLRLRQRLAGEKQYRVQTVARVGSNCEVPDPTCSFESAAQRITAISHVFHPRRDCRKAKRRPRLEPFKPALFNELVADFGET